MINLTKQINRKWLLLIPTVLLAAILGVFFQQKASSLPEEDVTIVYWETDKEYGVTYGYGVDNFAHEAIAEIYPDYDSVAGIYKYQAFSNRELAKILGNAGPQDAIPLKITFNMPFTEEEFASFVEKHEIMVDKYTLFLLEPSGNLVTVEGTPDEDGQLISDTMFNMAMSGVNEASGSGTQFLGWVDVSGRVEANRIQNITNESSVFLADGMQAVFEANLTDSKLKEVGIGRNIRRDVLSVGFASVGMPPLASFLYEYGLMELYTQK